MSVQKKKMSIDACDYEAKKEDLKQRMESALRKKVSIEYQSCPCKTHPHFVECDQHPAKNKARAMKSPDLKKGSRTPRNKSTSKTRPSSERKTRKKSKNCKYPDPPEPLKQQQNDLKEVTKSCCKGDYFETLEKLEAEERSVEFYRERYERASLEVNDLKDSLCAVTVALEQTKESLKKESDQRKSFQEALKMCERELCHSREKERDFLQKSHRYRTMYDDFDTKLKALSEAQQMKGKALKSKMEILKTEKMSVSLELQKLTQSVLSILSKKKASFGEMVAELRHLLGVRVRGDSEESGTASVAVVSHKIIPQQSEHSEQSDSPRLSTGRKRLIQKTQNLQAIFEKVVGPTSFGGHLESVETINSNAYSEPSKNELDSKMDFLQRNLQQVIEQNSDLRNQSEFLMNQVKSQQQALESLMHRKSDTLTLARETNMVSTSPRQENSQPWSERSVQTFYKDEPEKGTLCSGSTFDRNVHRFDRDVGVLPPREHLTSHSLRKKSPPDLLFPHESRCQERLIDVERPLYSKGQKLRQEIRSLDHEIEMLQNGLKNAIAVKKNEY